MKTYRMCFAALGLAALFMATDARAISFTNVDADNIHATPGWVGYSNWFYGIDAFLTPNLPTGAMLTPDTPLLIDLELTHSLTAAASTLYPTAGLLWFDYYFLDPMIAPGETGPDFSAYFTLNGTPVSGTFTLLGFSNTSTTAWPSYFFGSGFEGMAGVTFDAIHITLTSPVERAMGGFDIGIAVEPIPDVTYTAALLMGALIAMLGWAKCAPRRAA